MMYLIEDDSIGFIFDAIYKISSDPKRISCQPDL